MASDEQIPLVVKVQESDEHATLRPPQAPSSQIWRWVFKIAAVVVGVLYTYPLGVAAAMMGLMIFDSGRFVPFNTLFYFLALLPWPFCGIASVLLGCIPQCGALVAWAPMLVHAAVLGLLTLVGFCSGMFNDG